MPRWADSRTLAVALAAVNLSVMILLGVGGWQSAVTLRRLHDWMDQTHRQQALASELDLAMRAWVDALELDPGSPQAARRRAEVQARLDELTTNTQAETDDDPHEHDEELEEVARLASFVASVDRSGASDSETLARFQRLTDSIAADERDELAQARARESELTDRLGRRLLSLALFGVAFVVVPGLGLLRRMRRDLAALLDAAKRIASGDLDARVDLRGESELARLGRGFNHMVEQLARSRLAREQAARRARDLAREAGVAQITTGVLHNVGNALNSVGVSLDMIEEQRIEQRLDRVARIGRMLEPQRDHLARYLADDPTGRRLAEYLLLLAPELERQSSAYSSELARLRERVDHLVRIVRAYQQHGITRLDYERIEPGALIEFALAVALSNQRQRRYRIVREVADLPALMLDKHRTLEILINLIRNAADAIDQAHPSDPLDPAPTDEHTLTIAAQRLADREIRFEVRDRGVGIPPGDLERIFVHGYTTKGEQGSGFGLHVSANAATEMGGRLSGASEGLGHGARFVLDLPFREPGEDE
ncbi:ATP-binding protein [Nannocystaceae bacterium ST9]